MVASGKSELTKYQQRKQEKCVLRTLDNLPMKYDSDDSKSLASSYRSIRSAQMDEAKWATLVSRNLHSESKRLFDDCLTKQTKDDPVPRQSARSSRSEVTQVTYRSNSVHTGPTRYGSPLYRRQPQDITHPSRTPSEPPPKYFRAKSPIEDKLKRSNSVFYVTRRTISRPYVPKTPPSYPNFDLVPSASQNEPEHNDLEERHSITPVHIMTRRPYIKMKISSLYPEPTVTMQDCSPAIKVEPVENGDMKGKTDDRGSMKSQTLPESSSVKVKEGTDKDYKHKGSSHLVVNIGCSKAGSVKSSSSIKGKRDTGTTMDKVSNKSKASRNRSTKKASQDLSENSKAQVNGLQLPTFICPSSEEKSREARIRHWLCDNTFTCADRHVPLVF